MLNVFARFNILAMRTTLYMQSCMPTLAASGDHGGVPFALLYGHIAYRPHLKVWGCTAYLLVDDTVCEKVPAGGSTAAAPKGVALARPSAFILTSSWWALLAL
jgi:hypothetical protein